MKEEHKQEIIRLLRAGKLNPSSMLTEERIPTMSRQELSVAIDMLEVVHAEESADIQRYQQRLTAYMQAQGIRPSDKPLDIIEFLREEDEPRMDYESVLVEVRRSIDETYEDFQELIHATEADFKEYDPEGLEMAFPFTDMILQSGRYRIDKLRALLKQKHGE